MAHGPFWTEAETIELRRLKAEGLKVREIAKRMNRSYNAVFERFSGKQERRIYIRRKTPDVAREPPKLEAVRPYDPLRDNPRMAKLLGGSR